MKELSIEEKAKRYDDVREKIAIRFGSNVAKEIFSEYEESEDEKIRKALINGFNKLDKSAVWYNGITNGQILAWLEKQDTPAKLSEEEQNRFAKGVLTSCALSFIDYLDAHKYEGKMCVSNGECEDIENAFHNAMWDRLHRYYCKYIEKQGELTHSEPTKESDQDVQNSGGLQPGIKQIYNLDTSKGEVIIPDDIDKECIDLCVKLSSLPHITTTESCCGHLKDNYRVFFECDDFAELGMLFRCVNRNYSDGKWRIEVDGGDVRPSCQFMLTSKLPFSTYEEMADSVYSLIENIDYWNDPKYDDYFLNKK